MDDNQLNVETKVHHVPILDDVVFPLDSQHTGFAAL